MVSCVLFLDGSSICCRRTEVEKHTGGDDLLDGTVGGLLLGLVKCVRCVQGRAPFRGDGSVLRNVANLDLGRAGLLGCYETISIWQIVVYFQQAFLLTHKHLDGNS